MPMPVTQRLTQALARLRHPLVRDLAWGLLSPPLLAPRMPDPLWPGSAWGERAFLDYEARLLALDADPTPLLAHMAARADQRLGTQFESLLGFWLADPANTLYTLLDSHIAVRQGSRTIGELDFLVQDHASGRVQHWEVAVKFYLGIHPGGDYRHWVGPGLRDRLDLKVDRLLHHQLPLARQPQGRALLAARGIDSCDSVCLLKGRLFYPVDAERTAWQPQAANPDHESGWWLPAAAFLARFGALDLEWLRLPRERWLTPVNRDDRIGDTVRADALLEWMAPGFDNQVLAVVGLRDGIEQQRGFLTPPGWPGPLPDETRTP